MLYKCPPLSDTIVFSDNARLAARLSCVLAKPRAYLPVIDGPRMQRPDREAEVIHRTNAVARSRARRVFLAGLTDKSADALTQKLPRGRCIRVHEADDLDGFAAAGMALGPPLIWGRDRIGIGLLQALRGRRPIVFEDRASPDGHVPPKRDHLVVCEEGDELAQVVAANYAYALGAGLFLIQETPKDHVEQIMERFYSVYESRDQSPSQALCELRDELRGIAADVPVPKDGSITFISDGLPFGFAFPEVPSTHLFSYPGLGIATLHGFAAEQQGTRGVQVATLVNPETTAAPEIDAAAKILSQQRLFVRVYQGQGADVTSVSEMIELFPYDLLIIATHCGDVSGHHWTYDFTDSEGLPRKLVVDIALGIGRTEDEDLLHVTQFMRFVALDGVPWNDREQKAKLYVGTAMTDFMDLTRDSNDEKLRPTIKDTVSRVIGSAAMKMHDNNFIALPRSLANESTPIVINNACVSWHRLASNFMFGGARGYVGTLFPISTTEAEEVLLRALGKHHGKMLPHAFWSAQREAYGDGPRRPYVVAGVYPQRIRATVADVPAYITSELNRGRDAWTRYRDHAGPHEAQRKRTVDAHVRFFERQLEWFQRRW
ncbi:MAG: hypothetical protein E8A46_01855 [Bradyrhizobium sp.]|uniref:hypothetical protein n=1 Tax=Bradyrhizobium sp. TaxID=376 RepID=UPI001207579B|nr:hypothetical protein [Bradyrhizobium sp.]THD57114.1 MAG: hypothetical protein E8A46_01855 [Bradyrhizobium sp.]